MSNFLDLMKKYWLLFLMTLLFIYIQVRVDLALPDYMSRIVDQGILQQDQDLILRIGYEMLLVSLIGGVFTILSGLLISKMATGFAKDIRQRIFTYIQRFSLAEINKFSISSLITRATNDVQQIQSVLNNFLRPLLFAPIIGFGAVSRAYRTAPSMSWIIGVSLILVVMLIIVTVIVSMPKFKLLQKLADDLNLVARQNLTGLRVIRAFDTQAQEQNNFDKVNKELVTTSLFVNRVMVLMQPIMMLVFNFTTILIIVVGAKAIGDNIVQVGQVMAFLQYAMQVIMAFLMISIMFIIIPRSMVSVDRLNEILDTEVTVVDPDRPKIIKGKIKGEIRFKDVAFKYPKANEPVISKITFVARSGETTAIIGSTGSGKSTLLNLIPRFFDATEGKITIDGTDIRDMQQSYLRDLIGYAPQKPILFSGTIGTNIKYADLEGDDSKMTESAKIAQAEEFIEANTEKYEANVAQAGANFSGGQKQRLSIARALYTDAPILLFDDTFSALDLKTDAKLRKMLRERTQGKTVVIVSQRIGTIYDADKIVVLTDKGRIAGMGTHSQLMKGCTVYREIARSQLSDEEILGMEENITYGQSLNKVDDESERSEFLANKPTVNNLH